MNNNISEHITYNEAIFSETLNEYNKNHPDNQISNEPSPEILENMKLTAKKIFEPVRTSNDVPINVNRFFSSPALNAIIPGSSKTSDHDFGKAIDMAYLPQTKKQFNVTNKDIFDYIDNNLEYDQLILEYPDSTGEPEWVHCGYRFNANRNMKLRSDLINGKIVYTAI